MVTKKTGDGGSVLERLRALPEAVACEVLGDENGPMSRQYLWQIRADPPRKNMSVRMLARVVARLRIGKASDPIRRHLAELFPDEFAVIAVKPRKPRAVGAVQAGRGAGGEGREASAN